MYGYIYKLISPNGKAYIGQVVEYTSNGNMKGINGRWKQHINCANKSDSTAICRAIRKHGHQKFDVLKLMRCDVNNLDLFEELFIVTHNTLVPNGYNLQTGGTNTKHSLETCQKRSESMKILLKNDEKRKIWSNAKLGVIHREKRKCKKIINQNLPKYIYYRESHNGLYRGYVVDHPNGTKRFSKQKYTLKDNLIMAKEYINKLCAMDAVQRLNGDGSKR